jgi:hypothetical protein
LLQRGVQNATVLPANGHWSFVGPVVSRDEGPDNRLNHGAYFSSYSPFLHSVTVISISINIVPVMSDPSSPKEDSSHPTADQSLADQRGMPHRPANVRHV